MLSDVWCCVWSYSDYDDCVEVIADTAQPKNKRANQQWLWLRICSSLPCITNLRHQPLIQRVSRLSLLCVVTPGRCSECGSGPAGWKSSLLSIISLPAHLRRGAVSPADGAFHAIIIKTKYFLNPSPVTLRDGSWTRSQKLFSSHEHFSSFMNTVKWF